MIISIKPQFFTLALLNKTQVLVPFILFVGGDGSRGDDALVPLGASLILALCLNSIEVHYRNLRSLRGSARLSFLCVGVTALISGVELFVLEKMGKLGGRVINDGIARTVLGLLAIFIPLALISTWIDFNRKLKMISEENKSDCA